MNNTIHFIITGGTIDSYYDATKDTARPFTKSILPEYIKSLKLSANAKFSQICMKDSRDVNIDDRKKIRDLIQTSKENRFIITHGTYTMPDTAKYLQSELKRKDISVILTGAMIPMNFPGSDAGFNIGFALSEILRNKQGIYVAMNGQLFLPEEVRKLVDEGKFVSIFNK